jgi:hypothetical protein
MLGAEFSFAKFINNFGLMLSYKRTMIIGHGLLLLALLLGSWYKKAIRVTNRQIVVCLSLTTIAFLDILVATRFVLRDLLWVETLITVLSVIYMCILLEKSHQFHKGFHLVCCVVFCILVISNSLHGRTMLARLDADRNQYIWQEDYWFFNIYGRNHLKYRDLMLERYGPVAAPEDVYDGQPYRSHETSPAAEIAKKHAMYQSTIKQIVAFVFQNQSVTHQNIGIAFEKFPVWRRDLAYRIRRLDKELQGAILVDTASEPLQKRTFFWDWHIKYQSEVLDKIKKSPSQDRLVVFTRADLQIFLFLHPEDLAHAKAMPTVSETPYKVVVSNAEHTMTLRGVSIENYTEFPVNTLHHQYFWVIRKG